MIIKLAKNIAAILFLLFIAFFIFAAATCSDTTGDEVMTDIHTQVADDAVEQYDIAKNQGDKIQVCVQAGMVSAAYLQAKDEANYNQWKATEKSDCAKAGL